ncbi:MAG TPA: hypothetical protein VF008_16485 [Niastella sp.]
MQFFDLHTHPNYKPFAHAHQPDGTILPMSLDTTKKTSLWNYDAPSLFDKLAHLLLSVTKFSQTNATAAHYGNVGCLVMALGCIEQSFFKNKLGTGIGNLVDDFAAGFGLPRIRTIETLTNYWHDLQNEITFIKNGANKVVIIDGVFCMYAIVNNFDQLQDNLNKNNLPQAGKTEDNPVILSVIISIEGMHVVNEDINAPLNEAIVLAKVKEIKRMEHVPWFVTFSHHFNNDLCGHARSLRGMIEKLTDQEKNINAPFNELGKKVLHLLLDNQQGRRILIDIKHMSIEARKYYRNWLSQHANGEIPLLISHGACNGLPRYNATVSNYPSLGKHFINPVENVKGSDGTWKEHNSINFYDDEIIDVVNSKGIMGLQLDERRLANDEYIKSVKNATWRHKIMHYRSELVWNQLQYMAEMLDDNGLFAWGNIAIGSDYDGIVDPLNSFWTIEQYPALAQYIERHAYNYFKEHPYNLKHSFNKISADELIERLFHRNALDFCKRWY